MKTNNFKFQKNQTSQRTEMINFFYHHFVMNFNLKQTQKFFLDKKNFNFYQQEVIAFTFANFETIIHLIEKNLMNYWSFSEIAHYEKGILIIAISEFFTHNVPKEIIIAEAIKITQKFSSFNAYTYINKILEIILTKTKKEFFVNLEL